MFSFRFARLGDFSAPVVDSRYTKTIERFHIRTATQLFIDKKCSVIRLQTAIVPDFRHLYVHATSTLSSSLLPTLGINMMSLMLRSMCLGPTG